MFPWKWKVDKMIMSAQHVRIQRLLDTRHDKLRLGSSEDIATLSKYLEPSTLRDNTINTKG